MARIKNKAGVYVTPTTYAFSAAASNALAAMPSDLRAAPVVQAPGATSWPITAYSFLFVYKQADKMGSTKAHMWVSYLYWALTTGQNYSRSMGYSPLPASVKAKALAQVHRITFGGSAVWP
jgi:phosphate transport system substrate-binding protein